MKKDNEIELLEKEIKRNENIVTIVGVFALICISVFIYSFLS